MCTLIQKVCTHLSPLKYSEGGCEKVRDRAIEFYNQSEIKNDIVNFLKKSKRIEKYDFITYGFESFNTLYNAFVVLKCNNYCPCIKNSEKFVGSKNKNLHKKEKSSSSFWENLSF